MQNQDRQPGDEIQEATGDTGGDRGISRPDNPNNPDAMPRHASPGGGNMKPWHCYVCDGSGTQFVPSDLVRSGESHRECWCCGGESSRGVFVVRLAIGEDEEELCGGETVVFPAAVAKAKRFAHLYRLLWRRRRGESCEVRVYYASWPGAAVCVAKFPVAVPAAESVRQPRAA